MTEAKYCCGKMSLACVFLALVSCVSSQPSPSAPRKDRQSNATANSASPLAVPSDREHSAGEGVLILGANPGCSPFRVFADVDDICERGIMPKRPWGRCRAMPSADNAEFAPGTQAETRRVHALGGVAYLLIHSSSNSQGVRSEHVYLALEGSNGHVLLGEISSFDSGYEEAPSVTMSGESSEDLHITTAKQKGPGGADFDKFETVCRADSEGSILCNDGCPDLAVVPPVQSVDCTAVRRLNWDSLSSGKETEWTGGMRDVETRIARDYLAKHGHTLPTDAEPVRASVLMIERRAMAVLTFEDGSSVLMHQEVPLLASNGELRIGLGPGGVFVVSRVGQEKRVQRLDFDTHDLEEVLPHPCGLANK